MLSNVRICHEVNATRPHWWFVNIGSGYGFGAVRQAITWTNADPISWLHTVSLGANDLIHLWGMNKMNIIVQTFSNASSWKKFFFLIKTCEVCS